MEEADGDEEEERLEDLALRNKEDVPHEQALDRLVPLGRLAEDHDGGRGGDNVHDADDGLLRHPGVAETGQREHGGADEGEEQGHDVGEPVMGGIRPEQDRRRHSESRDLGEGEIDEDHSSLHHVQTETRHHVLHRAIVQSDDALAHRLGRIDLVGGCQRFALHNVDAEFARTKPFHRRD